VLVLLIFSLLRPSEPAAQPEPATLVTSAAPIDSGEPQAEVERPMSPGPTTPAPEMGPELRAILAKLRTTYEPGGSKPNQFRLQHQLSALWGETPPVDILLHESTDPIAPPKYRAHFARRLLSLGKVASAEASEQLAGEMRAALVSAPPGSQGLAQALVAFDDSPANIGAVRRLLDRPIDDRESAGFVAALTLSHSLEAQSVLWDYSREISAEADRFPRTLATVLPPLARLPDLEIEPVLERVLSTSSNLPLYETAIQSCFARMPSESSLAVIRLAHQRSTRFDADQQSRIEQLLRAGLLRWQHQSTDASPAQNDRIETLLKQI